MRSWHMEPSHHKSEFRKFQNLKSGLADDGLAVVARHVVEPHAVVVEVVEDRQADLVTFSVIWLRSVSSPSVGPVNIIIRPARRPANVASPDLATSPEIFLTLPANQAQELPLLGRAVQADRSHTIAAAE